MLLSHMYIGSEVTAEDHIKVYADVLKREVELTEGAITVAAFNIQIFGITKFSKNDVVDVLSRVSLWLLSLLLFRKY